MKPPARPWDYPQKSLTPPPSSSKTIHNTPMIACHTSIAVVCTSQKVDSRMQVLIVILLSSMKAEEEHHARFFQARLPRSL